MRAYLCAVMDLFSDALCPFWTCHLASANSPPKVPGISLDCQGDVSLHMKKIAMTDEWLLCNAENCTFNLGFIFGSEISFSGVSEKNIK